MRIRFIATIAFFSLIYTFFYSVIPESLITIYKLFPTILIILLASIMSSKNVAYKKNILIAFIFFLIGDYALQWVIVSITSYLIGYLFYLRAFLTVKSKEVPSYIKWMLIILGVSMIYWIGGSALSEYGFMITVAISTYIIVVLSIAWTSFKTVSYLAIAGALLLLLSNLIVLINIFVSPIDYSHQLIMLTYYTAQLLLALSIADYSDNKVKSDTI